MPCSACKPATPHQATRLRCSGLLSAEHQAELQSLESCDPLSLYTSWKAAASNGWQTALSPDALLRLGLLLSSSEDDAITRLRSDLQEVFGEAMAQADRPLALQLWDQLCRRCPDWSWARLMACDLALQEDQLELCHHHIEAAPESERRSISLLDVEALLGCGNRAGPRRGPVQVGLGASEPPQRRQCSAQIRQQSGMAPCMPGMNVVAALRKLQRPFSPASPTPVAGEVPGGSCAQRCGDHHNNPNEISAFQRRRLVMARSYYALTGFQGGAEAATAGVQTSPFYSR